jgi:molybdopterin molybdotransferase
MLEVADALAVVLQHARPLRLVPTAIGPALLNQTLVDDVTADRDSPPFAKSLRDGYAVRAVDCIGAAELRVIEEIAAGVIPRKTIGPGDCARIFTGAPIPDGADAVVMQEDTEAAGDRVRIADAAVKPGQYVFPRGAEMRAGDVVIPAGTRLNAAAIGVLASVGRAVVPVVSLPRLSVLATGDELVDAIAEPAPGQIRNSNGPMLVAQAAGTGAVVRDRGIARDTPEDLRSKIGGALAASDVVLLAGGVSAGKFDLVPGVLQELGVVPHFHKVRMKPGKPLLFGTTGDTLVFGLPGNPVSAFVCFELFVRPALRKMAGDRASGPRMQSLPLAEMVAESNDRPKYRPAKLVPMDSGWTVRPLPWAGAPDLRGLQPADALMVLPAGDVKLDLGMSVPVILLGERPA